MRRATIDPSSLLRPTAVARRAHGAANQVRAAGGPLALGGLLAEGPGEVVAEGGHGDVLVGEALGVVGRPAHKRRVVDLLSLRPTSQCQRERRHRSCGCGKTYVGPLGVVVLQLTLQRDGRHKVLPTHKHPAA